MKAKDFFFPPKENTKASEMATLKEGDFVVLLPKCFLFGTWYLYLKSRISVPVKLVLFTLLSVSMSSLTFPQYFENQLWKKNVVQKVLPKTDVRSQSTKFQSTSLLLLRYKTRGPTPLGRTGAKSSQRSFQSFPTTWHCLHPNWLQSVSVWGQSTERT